MRAAMHLGRLHGATQNRLKRLRNLNQSVDTLPKPQQNIRLSYIAIELDNLNISALREFAISTIRRAKTLSGQRISITRNIGEAEEEIAAYMLSIVNRVRYQKMQSPARIRRADEQAVRDPKQIETILLDCGASNLPSLQNALALNSTLFRDIKSIRHFYAHRNKDTFVKAASGAAGSLGIMNLDHPDQILRHVVTGKPTSVLEEWLIDAEIFYDLLMQ